jgi:PAS domain S-box-containing protein
LTRAGRNYLLAFAGAAGLAAGIVLLVFGQSSALALAPVATSALSAIIVWSFTFAGIVALVRRPDNRTGVLMIWAGFTWFLSSLQLANADALFTIGLLCANLPLGSIPHLLLAFPEGRLSTWPARIVTGAGYVIGGAIQFAVALMSDPTVGGACGICPANLVLAEPNASAAQTLQKIASGASIAVALAALTILVIRWRRSTAPARRATAPVLISGAVAAAVAAVLFTSSFTNSQATVPARLATYAAIALVPLAFLAALLRTRLAQSAVGRLVLELSGGQPPGRVREAIARALGDPSLEVAYWLPERSAYVDFQGREVELPDEGTARAVTIVERDGRRVAALIHDRSLSEQGALVEGVAAAAGLALENARLQAELRARLEQLAASEDRLRALVDASPLAIVETAEEGHVTFWNRAAEELFGWTAEEAIGQHISIIHPESETDPQRIRRELARGEPVQGVEVIRRRKDGTNVDLALSAAPIVDPNGQIVRRMAVAADISARKRATEELRRERDFITALIDTAAALVVVIDRNDRYIRFNRACERLTGYSFEEIRDRPLWELFADPAEHDAIRQVVRDVWSGRFPIESESHWILRDGSRRLIAWSNTALLDERGDVEFIVSSGVDITDRKRIEEEVRASRARIVEAADLARRRLERNLHDGAQQRLVALSLALRMARAQVRSNPDAAEEMLTAAGEELAQALDELRELARGIHPAVLIDRGLEAALEALANRSPVPVDVEIALERRLPEQVEAAAYYVVSEALANVAKYADASAVTVTVGQDNGAARVDVVDDGIGGANPQTGTGLRGLADRVEALDGRLVVTSEPGRGTRVHAEIPCG